MTLQSFLDALLTGGMWMLNGILFLLYLAVEHGWTLAFALPAWELHRTAEDEQAPWVLGSVTLAAVASLFTYPLVGAWLFVMALGAVVTLRLERFNPLSLRWRIVSGIALYALVGIGVRIYHLLAPAIDSGNLFSQGSIYLDIISGVAVWLTPVGFIGLLAQSIFAHPPTGRPEDLIYQIRTRSQGD